MDEEEFQARIEALKEKSIAERFSALERRLEAIETERARVVGWAVKAFLVIAIYMFKDPAIKLWGMLK
jgi:hypothetical protein